MLRTGLRGAATTIAVYVGHNELGHPRVGFAVSGKLGNAVVRNRVRRRLRELARPLAATSPIGRDVLVVARAEAVDAKYERLKSELEMLWERVVQKG